KNPRFPRAPGHRLPILELARCGGLAGKRLTVALFATARHFPFWRAVPICRELLRNYRKPSLAARPRLGGRPRPGVWSQRSGAPFRQMALPQWRKHSFFSRKLTPSANSHWRAEGGARGIGAGLVLSSGTPP